MDKKTFKEYVLKNGYVTLDEDGEDRFVVTQINDKNFKDMGPKFKKQLEDEGKYNSWIGFITFEKKAPYTVQMLPIYGSSERYVTKWFTNTEEQSVDSWLNDRQVRLLIRANKYIGNN